jgi:hypothetical protein
VNSLLNATSNNSFKLTGDCVLVMVTWVPFGVDVRQLNSSVRLASHCILENKLTVNQVTEYIRATEGGNIMSTVDVKEEAKRLIEKLPENMTWDDLMHEIYVRQSIEAGLADSQTGKVTDVAEVRAKFGLQS